MSDKKEMKRTPTAKIEQEDQFFYCEKVSGSSAVSDRKM